MVGSVARMSASRRGYGPAWQRLSREQRARQPWCSLCGSREDLTVDHVVALSRGGTSDRANTRTLCRSCNSARAGGWFR